MVPNEETSPPTASVTVVTIGPSHSNAAPTFVNSGVKKLSAPVHSRMSSNSPLKISPMLFFLDVSESPPPFPNIPLTVSRKVF